MKKSKQKAKKERRVLIAALLVAAITIAGSTFAWFSSKDEVTNRLTATANYGVSIVEDFKPTENMTPGQEVNKDVSAVNTGSVDAFVRLGIENMLSITKSSGTSVTLGEATTTYYYTDGTSGNVNNADVAYELKDFVVSYTFAGSEVELSDHEYTDANGNLVANEVSLIQAGGELVVEAGKAVAVTDQPIKSGDDTDSDYSGADQYKPTESGLYIFRRTNYEGNNGTTVKYAGYWYDYNADKYYALVTDADTVYLPEGAVTETASIVTALNASKIQVKTTQTIPAATAKNNVAMSFVKYENNAYTAVTAENTAQATHIKAVYDPDSTAATGDEVTFYIKLDTDWARNWTYVAKDNIDPTEGKALGYFYLNDDLEAGATSPKLINSVTMDSTVTQQAFADLTYDINVVLDSVQVTADPDGKETTESTSTWNADVSITAQTAEELSDLAWAELAP